MDSSDSEEEDEYLDNYKIYDSDSEGETDSNNEDKRRILTFFNEATEPEVAAIQGTAINISLHTVT